MKEKHSYKEIMMYLQGLDENTPLAKLVRVRAEVNPKVIKTFTKEQKKIHREWQQRLAKESANDTKYTNSMNDMFKGFFAEISKI